MKGEVWGLGGVKASEGEMPGYKCRRGPASVACSLSVPTEGPTAL